MFENISKTKKTYSKLFKIQLMECMLVFTLIILSYSLAGKLIYNTIFPMCLLNKHLDYFILSTLAVIILSYKKFFRFLEQSYAEALRKIIVTGFLINVFYVISLYFKNIILSFNYFIVVYVLQIVFLITVKLFSSIFKRKIIQDNYNLVIVNETNTSKLLKTLQKQCRGKIVVASPDDKNIRKYEEKAVNIYLTGSVTEQLKEKVISYCSISNKRVYIVPEIFEITVRKSTVSYIGDTPVFVMDSFQWHRISSKDCQIL